MATLVSQELALYVGAIATVFSAIVGATAAVWAALLSRENRRKLTTPGDGSGTIGEQVESIRKD